jgi:hypothetical protein
MKEDISLRTRPGNLQRTLHSPSQKWKKGKQLKKWSISFKESRNLIKSQNGKITINTNNQNNLNFLESKEM